jgi:hypothetical protein
MEVGAAGSGLCQLGLPRSGKCRLRPSSPAPLVGADGGEVVKVLARELAGQAAQRDTLVNAACPGLVDTGASRPWFDDISGALSPDEAATDVLWLATLPAGAREPYGELVQHRKVLPFTPTV